MKVFSVNEKCGLFTPLGGLPTPFSRLIVLTDEVATHYWLYVLTARVY